MEILINDNSNIDGAKNIIINGKYYTITNECFIDYEELGRTIHIEYNKQNPLDLNIFNIVKDKIKHELGVKHYDDRIAIDISLNNIGNVIYIHVYRYISGVIAGGFISENTSYYILDKIDDILNKINEMKKLSKDELRYLSVSELDRLTGE